MIILLVFPGILKGFILINYTILRLFIDIS